MLAIGLNIGMIGIRASNIIFHAGTINWYRVLSTLATFRIQLAAVAPTPVIPDSVSAIPSILQKHRLFREDESEQIKRKKKKIFTLTLVLPKGSK